MTTRIQFAVCLASVLLAGIVAPSLPAEESAVPSFNGQLGNERIWDTLRRPLPPEGLNFPATPLEEIVQQLRDVYEIEIQFDHHALEGIGIDATQPIDLSLRNISLQAALKLMLNTLDLTYVVTNEVLLITSREEAEKKLALCVYPVRDLLVPTYKRTEADKKLNLPPELIPVAKVLVTTVASDTWSENGKGEASVSGMEPGLLVISQSQSVHEQVRDALAALRRAKQFAQEKQPAPAVTKETSSTYGGPARRPTAAGEGDLFARVPEPSKNAEAEDLFGVPSPQPSKKSGGGDQFAP